MPLIDAPDANSIGGKMRGGKRDNAGRKPIDPELRKIAVSFKLDRSVLEFLRSTGNATNAIERAITRSAAYREWSKQNER